MFTAFVAFVMQTILRFASQSQGLNCSCATALRLRTHTALTVDNSDRRYQKQQRERLSKLTVRWAPEGRLGPRAAHHDAAARFCKHEPADLSGAAIGHAARSCFPPGYSWRR